MNCLWNYWMQYTITIVITIQLHALDLVLFQDIAFNFHPNLYFTGFDILYPNNVPIEPNGSDCVLYVMKFMNIPCAMLFPTYMKN